MNKYDIIGDIHGHGDELVSLLQKLGYEPDGDCYGHPDGNKVIYLGDFIDRGPKHRLVLDTVKPMVERGMALSIMGNHEFNAICFNTPDPDNESEYLRPRIDKNIKQHEAFLEAYPDQDERNEVIDWFKTLPLWLDMGHIRAIHACWHEESINNLKPVLNQDNTLSDPGFIQASRKGTDVYNAVETLLKGVETLLPDGEKFDDKDGNPRYEIRTQWWNQEAKTYAEAALPKGIVSHLTEHEIPESACHGYPEYAPPLFIGHYWMKGAPKLLKSNIACLDYSVAKGGELMSYRWQGESTLVRSHFKSVKVFGNQGQKFIKSLSIHKHTLPEKVLQFAKEDTDLMCVLESLTHDELEPLVKLLSEKPSSSLTLADSDPAHIAAEIQLLAGDTVVNTVRGRGVNYRKILQYVAKPMGISFKKESIQELEQQVLDKFWNTMAEEEQAQFLKELDSQKSGVLNPNGIKLRGALILTQVGALSVKFALRTNIILAPAILAQMFSGPARKVIFPAIIYIAAMRGKIIEKRSMELGL